MLLPLALREGGGKASFQEIGIAQLRELFETRGLDFPGHLDKASLVKQLEEHDEFFAAERHAAALQADDEAFPIQENFKSERENACAQRRAILALLELDDYWAQQEAELRKLQKQDEDDQDYDPFHEATTSNVAHSDVVTAGREATHDGAVDDEDDGLVGAVSLSQGGTFGQHIKILEDDGAVDDEDDLATPVDAAEVEHVEEIETPPENAAEDTAIDDDGADGAGEWPEDADGAAAEESLLENAEDSAIAEEGADGAGDMIAAEAMDMETPMETANAEDVLAGPGGEDALECPAAADDEYAAEQEDAVDCAEADPYFALTDPYATLLEEGDGGGVDDAIVQEEDAVEEPPTKARRMM